MISKLESTSRLKHVSWVYGTFAEINYYPKEEKKEEEEFEFETMHECKKRFAQLRILL